MTLREGIRLVECQEAEDEALLNALHQVADDAIADIGAGDFRSFGALAPLRDHP